MPDDKILIVEDEEDITELIRYNLHKEGYEISSAQTGEDALIKIYKNKPDLILLDLMLPGIDGLELCAMLKNNSSHASIPIIMVSAKGEESDIIKGLELGAYDYITKPFSVKILVTRVKTVLRRKQFQEPPEKEIIKRDILEIHPGKHEIQVNSEITELTSSEFKALHFLARKPGWVYTRNQIVKNIHGESYPVTDRAIDVLIVSLRKKLGKAGHMIETVRGVGYRFME